MISLFDSIGMNAADDGDSLRIAALGAVVRKGLPVTDKVRALAAQLGQVWRRGGDPVQVLGILYRLGLTPDEILPPDDDDLAEVTELGRQADADSGTQSN